MLIFETERLIIRDHLISDLKDYHQLLSDAEAMKYLEDIRTSTWEESRAALEYAVSEPSMDCGTVTGSRRIRTFQKNRF